MQRKITISRTLNIPKPNLYIESMLGEFSHLAYTEDKAPEFKGKWREAAFNIPTEALMDLEIGTGNGTHFAHQVKKQPERYLVGLELKYKPLIQTIRRAVNNGSLNGRMARYHANMLSDIFAPEEVNNVYIHFPDPWPKKRKWKNRLIQKEFLEALYEVIRPGGFVEFKTDSFEYYEWALPLMQESPFKIEFVTTDLHNSERKEQNFSTAFEKIFLRQGIKINAVTLRK